MMVQYSVDKRGLMIVEGIPNSKGNLLVEHLVKKKFVKVAQTAVYWEMTKVDSLVEMMVV
jgi:hypothetical protein